MFTVRTALAAFTLCAAGGALAGALQLAPADPQPSGLNPGLSVAYAYPPDVKSLSQAERALQTGAEPGTPLAGMDYWDTEEGEVTLTAKRAFHVAARIEGFVKFDAPGVYDVDFLSNDGLEVEIGGQTVLTHDGRHACEPTETVQLAVPAPGWYPLRATYFQRLGTACLHMRAAPAGSEPQWMDNSAFAYR
ncbi:PA14 domain-containing protein [Salinihabitans flavidus]|uniref:PA14 domain-containing protein n=1 Tax=Salinihabitans flavidus TaxID=569882 RepID=A0A1H8Q7D9_9RHOB|nr:PA14 domain-containing protein [Salinihabitans flavidus]SEO49817.1 PA14 domain-containing protein [Salinihabitans flavidus]